MSDAPRNEILTDAEYRHRWLRRAQLARDLADCISHRAWDAFERVSTQADELDQELAAHPGPVPGILHLVEAQRRHRPGELDDGARPCPRCLGHQFREAMPTLF
jgi:hypothetical protein